MGCSGVDYDFGIYAWGEFGDVAGERGYEDVLGDGDCNGAAERVEEKYYGVWSGLVDPTISEGISLTVDGLQE